MAPVAGARIPLIVNADDYGLTEGVSRGILRAHREGIVSSTSVLAVAPAFEQTARWLAEVPHLGVGVHLCLVGEDPPLTPAGQIPTLVDSAGRFPPSWRDFLMRAALGRVDRADVERELSAQIERVFEAKVKVTHLDSHQHLHLWPAVGDVAIALASRFGVAAIRVPRSRGRRLAGAGVSLLGRRLAARARQRGLAFPDAAAGFDEAGAMDLAELTRTMERLARTRCAGVEIGVHPGEPNDPALGRYAWNYRWADELAALIDPRAKAVLAQCGFVLSTYAALTP